MPRPDRPPRLRAQHLSHFRRVVKLLAVFSLVVAAIAVLLVARGGEGLHIHLLIATALGVGLMVFLGTALMSLVFLSSSSGHDEDVAQFERDKDE